MRAKIFAMWLVFFILGSMVAPVFESAPTTFLIFGAVLLISSFLVFGKRYVFGIIFGVGLLLISIGLFQLREAELVRANNNYADKSLEIIGMVSDLPVTNQFGQSASLETRIIDGAEKQLKLKIYVNEFPTLEYGQSLHFTTKIKSYGDKKWQLAKNGYIGEANVSEYSLTASKSDLWDLVRGKLFAIRKNFNESIQKLLPSAEAGLASGLILGEKAMISPEVQRQLQISGTTHIIALSGYNITIILGLFVILRKKFSRLMNLLIPIIFIIAFTVMTGGAPSLVRAAMMGFMPLLASYLGRESDSFIAILFSAAVMIVFNPFLTLFDVGFQLSFAALAGMIYLAPILIKLLYRIPEFISVPFAETIGAQLAAMPLISYYFGSVSLVSPLSNLLILSLVPIGMLTAFLIGFCGLILQPLATLIAIPGYFILQIINLLIAFFGGLPAASQSIKIENPIWILLIYFALFDLWLMLYKVRRSQPVE